MYLSKYKIKFVCMKNYQVNFEFMITTRKPSFRKRQTHQLNNIISNDLNRELG